MASGCVAVVDPYSTGCCVALECHKRGYKVIAMWSKDASDELKMHRPTSCDDLVYYSELTEKSSIADTAAALKHAAGEHEIVACMVGGESGVPLADALSEHLKVQTNGTQIPQRRDKKIQQELVKAAGLRSVRQAGGTSLSDVSDFLASEPMPVVVKPVESAGSDGVKLCHTKEEAEEHFKLLMSAQQKVGSQGAAVLCQEFLKGKEYVIDHVSVDGKHKTVMVWVYDKRAVNGAAFVYHGMLPVDSESPEAKVMIPYVRGVLDALQIKNGPTHGEVMMTADGPCLVEMNCRAHGGDGTWGPLAKALTGGYCQIDAAADSFLDHAAFNKLPDKMPSPFRATGQEVMLVSFTEGTVTETPGYQKIRELPSFVYLEASVKVGGKIERTTDLFSNVGSCILMHQDPVVLAKDVESIRQMEQDYSMFDLDESPLTLRRPRADSTVTKTAIQAHAVVGAEVAVAGRGRTYSRDREDMETASPRQRTGSLTEGEDFIVVVDPYSTGCCLAHECSKRGFKVIAMWSKEASDELKSHKPLSCADLVYHAELTESSTIEDTAAAVKASVSSGTLVACMVGGESGVPTADTLSEFLKLRTNGTQIPQRRDKKIQQELVKEKGLRSVRQAGGKLLSDVDEFLKSEEMPVVVKPVESAGSDGVKLCHSYQEAVDHFHVLMNAQQKVGSQGAAVLCQEFLKGKEYVVDHVSQDGVHKTVMVWVYDKRAVNGAAFVYHGMLPVDSESAEAKVLIPYVRGVLDALQITNGASHGEVMMTESGPCLVEMNCRAHGGDGTWMPLARALTGGYCQVDAGADSFVDSAAFAALPDKPPSPFKAAGQEVMLVSFSKGKVTAMPGFEKIKALPSFVCLETGVDIGSQVEYTVDLFTNVGSCILMHQDSAQVAKDIETIRQLEKDCELFEYEGHGVVLSRPRTSSETKPKYEDLVNESSYSWCVLM